MHLQNFKSNRKLKRMMMSEISIWILVICCGMIRISHGYANCTIKWSDPLPSWYPLVFNSSGIIYPQRTGNNSDWSIVLRRSSNFNLGCSDATNSVKGYTSNEVNVVCSRTGLTVSMTLLTTVYTYTSTSTPKHRIHL